MLSWITDKTAAPYFSIRPSPIPSINPIAAFVVARLLTISAICSLVKIV